MCDMNLDYQSFVPQGWQCPVCKRVYSPSTPWCYFCWNQETTTTTTTSVEINVEPPNPFHMPIVTKASELSSSDTTKTGTGVSEYDKNK